MKAKKKTKKKDLLHDEFVAACSELAALGKRMHETDSSADHVNFEIRSDEFCELAANYVDVLERRLARIAAKERRATNVMNEEAWAKRVAAIVVRELQPMYSSSPSP